MKKSQSTSRKTTKPKAPTQHPERTCVGCFKKHPPKELLAITRLKTGEIHVNPEHKIAGRSAYLCYQKACFLKAKNRKGKNGLQYTLKVAVPETVWKEIEQILGEKAVRQQNF